MDGQGATLINPVWKEVWKLCIPGKVRIFLWKVLHGVLPCHGVLANRHIPVQVQCHRCAVGFEDIQHCLFGCKRAKQVWKEIGLYEEIQKAIVLDRSGSVNMEHLICELTMIDGEIKSAELIAVAVWYIWWQCRQEVRDEHVQPADKTTVTIKAMTLNFMRANSSKIIRRKEADIWKKPSQGVSKVNVDASFHVDSLSGA